MNYKTIILSGMCFIACNIRTAEPKNPNTENENVASADIVAQAIIDIGQIIGDTQIAMAKIMAEAQITSAKMIAEQRVAAAKKEAEERIEAARQVGKETVAVLKPLLYAALFVYAISEIHSLIKQ